jgi:propanol-preferring alcohol dehydrogenase
MSIPELQQAAVVENPGDKFTVVLRDDIPVGTPGTDEILIKLNCTGIW